MCIWNVDFSWESFQNFNGAFDELRIVGVPWEREAFLQKSLEIKHALDKSAAMPTEIRFAVQQMAQKDPIDLAKQRLEFFKFWNKRARELVPDEEELRKSMDPLVSHAVRQKRLLLLFKEMLGFYKYPDQEVVSELIAGADLVGEVPVTDMLPTKFTPALLTEQALAAQSGLRRALVEVDFKGARDEDRCRGSSLLVKTFDLASAYRQVGLSEKGRKFAYIRVFNPESKCWAYFQARVLPFGAVKRVHFSWLRLARAVWWLGVVACALVWSSFFDDCIVFSSTPAFARSTDLTAIAYSSCLEGTLRKKGESSNLSVNCVKHLEFFSTWKLQAEVSVLSRTLNQG
eukprot:s178_g49.t1